MALNLVMLGPPGAGKGTQAERFAREHGIPKISTGDILRDEAASGSELGQALKQRLDRGELVSDDLIIGIVRDRLAKPDAAKGFVLDGFPRTVPQAHALDRLLEGRGPLIVVEIQVPDEELVRRVRSRRVCVDCGTSVSAFSGDPASIESCLNCGGKLVPRSDDTEDVVRKRLEIYWRNTQPMIDYYHARPTWRVVNGAQAPERVREALVDAVQAAVAEPASPKLAGSRASEGGDVVRAERASGAKG